MIARSLLIASLALPAMAGTVRAQQPAPPADTSAVARQIDVGGQWFRARCVECHADNLSDGTFRTKWSGRSAYALFDLMRNTMPDSDPGGLTPETYAAVTAYLMKLNGMPAGAGILQADSSSLANVKLLFNPINR